MAEKARSRRTERAVSLTQGEKLLILRKRKNWNQTKAARHHRLSVYNYKMLEYDQLPGHVCKNLEIGTLAPHEICLIYRKRSNKTQVEIAEEMGIGRYWLRLQEQGKVSPEKLLSFWERQQQGNRACKEKQN